MGEPLPELLPFSLAGPVGRLDGRLELPDPDLLKSVFERPRFLAVFGHPDPRRGGTMQNLVVVHGARALARLGGAVARFDFRGVGKSEGSFDGGRGELDDFQAVAAKLRSRWPDVATLLAAGFSFGAMRALECAAGGAAQLCLAVAPPFKLVKGGKDGAEPLARVECPAGLVLAGADELVAAPTERELADRFADLRAVETVAGAGHLFSGRIKELAAAVERVAQALLRSLPTSPPPAA